MNETINYAIPSRKAIVADISNAKFGGLGLSVGAKMLDCVNRNRIHCPNTLYSLTVTPTLP